MPYLSLSAPVEGCPYTVTHPVAQELYYTKRCIHYLVVHALMLFSSTSCALCRCSARPASPPSPKRGCTAKAAASLHNLHSYTVWWRMLHALTYLRVFLVCPVLQAQFQQCVIDTLR